EALRRDKLTLPIQFLSFLARFYGDAAYGKTRDTGNRSRRDVGVPSHSSFARGGVCCPCAVAKAAHQPNPASPFNVFSLGLRSRSVRSSLFGRCGGTYSFGRRIYRYPSLD